MKGLILALLSLMYSSQSYSQEPGSGHQHQHSTGTTQQQDHAHTPSEAFIAEILHHATSGTTAEPDSSPHSMLMTSKNGWKLMFHGVAFLNALQQSGPRGDDKVFATSWFMPMAQRQFGRSELTLRAMVSFDPATVTHRFYPELFQQGETAFGSPITDGQHPHDFFMELGLLYDVRLGDNALLSFYAAPVGDPAIGPAAYAHRSSASENPLATLGHHLQDSTHIANDVITAGLTYKSVRLEGSGFHGREPDEFRWNIDSGRIDSWSSRLTVQPGNNWSVQYSFAHLTSPEELHPVQDLERMTISLMYNRPFTNGNWATTLLWGRNHWLAIGKNFNGYLAETTVQFAAANYLWARIESADRTTELLLNRRPEPAGFEENLLARVQAYTAGYDHEFKIVPHLATALGGQVTFYNKPSFLTPLYGNHPVGTVLFLRVRPTGRVGHHHM